MVNGPINGAKSGDIKLVSADVEHSDGSVPTQKPVVIPLEPGLTLGNTIPTEKTLVSDWTEWSQCSAFDQAANCGPGTKTRKDRNFGTNETVKVSKLFGYDTVILKHLFSVPSRVNGRLGSQLKNVRNLVA